MTNNIVNIDDLLYEPYQAPVSNFDTRRTKTSQFLLNMLFTNTSLTSTEYFVNAFIGDDEFKHGILRPVFVLFSVKGKDEKWDAIVKRLRMKEEYVLDYYCGVQDGRSLIMVLFQAPQKWAKDYDCFIAGQYSKMSEAYKRTFQRYSHNEHGVPIESTLYKVLYKSKELRKELEAFFTVRPKHPYKFSPEDELWGIPERNYEIYRCKTEETQPKDLDSTKEKQDTT